MKYIETQLHNQVNANPNSTGHKIIKNKLIIINSCITPRILFVSDIMSTIYSLQSKAQI